MKILYVANSNMKYLNDVKNLITMDNYKDQKLFIRMCTVHYLMKNFKYKNLIRARNRINTNVTLVGVNIKLFEDFNTVSTYIQNNKPNATGAFLENVYEHVIENNLLDQNIINKADHICDYLNDIPLISHVDWNIITVQDLAVAIFRYNKGVPVTKLKKMNPNYYVNLNETELSWLNDKEQKLYTKCRLI